MPGRRAVARNLALDLVAAVGIGVTASLVTALLPTIARRSGVEPMGLAALAAAPFLANLLGAFAGRFGPRSTSQLAIIRGAGATALLILFVLPTPAVMIGVVVAFWLSVSMTGPFHLRLWGAMYPRSVVGRVIGFIGMGRAAAGALAAFVGGLIADRVGGPGAVALAGVVGIACALAYAGLRASSNEPPPAFSPRESVRALRERPVLSRVALAQGFYGGGLIAAVPLYALVHVDRLNLTLSDVGVVGILAATATTIAFPLWGAVADRHGALVALRTGSMLGVVSLAGYALAPNVAVLWAMALALGAANASIDVGIASIISNETTLAARSAAMAGWNTVTGARGIAAAFVMSGLLSLGLVNVTSGLVLCGVSAAIGVVLFVRVDLRTVDVDPAPLPALTDVRGATALP